MAIKKVLLTKKLNNTIYDIFPKTSADVVTYGDSTVAAALAAFATDLNNVYSKTDADAKTKAACDALYNKIMGITEEDGATVDQAYDTLKEVAAWIDEHGDVAAAFTTDITALKTAVGEAPAEGKPGSGLLKAMAEVTAKADTNATDIEALEQAVTDLQTAVGNASAGLVKTVADHTTDITALKTAVGEEPNAAAGKAGSGILKRVADLEAAGATKVEKSDTNGNIKVNGVEVEVYKLPSTLDAAIIKESEDRKFVTADQLGIINNAAAIKVVADQSAVDNERDLFMVEITA